MKKTLASLFFGLFVFLNASAQKEIYFNTTKPKDLKVETLKGVDLQIGYNPLEILYPHRYFNQIPYSASFFYEKRIAPTMTLKYSVGLYGSTLKMPVFTNDSILGGYSSGFGNKNYEQGYTLGLRVGIEPRWYWDFKKRAELNNAKLNSGWFLSLPFNYEYTLYTSYKPTYPPNYQPVTYRSYGYMTLMPTIGYRQSITKNIFLEGSFGYGMGYSLGSVNRNFYSFFNTTNPELKFKAAYTFN